MTHAVAEAASAATAMSHPGLAGQVREIALRNCIAPYLTHSFRCGIGKIIDTTGHVTKQIDLVVYQTKLAPPLLFSNELGLFPAECCAYAFEVKSKLTALEIQKSLAVMETVSQLRRFPNHGKNGALTFQEGSPATVLFAFDADISGNELKRYLMYDKRSNPVFTSMIVLTGC